MKLDPIIQEIKVEIEGFQKQIKTATESVEAARKMVAKETAGMVSDIESALAKVPAIVETNVTQAYQKAAAHAQQSAKQIAAANKEIAASQALAQATADYHASAPANPLGPEIAAMQAKLLALKESSAGATVANVGKMAAASATLTKSLSGVGNAAMAAAPWIGIVSADAGLATAGLGMLGTAAGPVAAALGTFTVALETTAFAIGGTELAAQALPLTLEGLYMSIDTLTMGYTAWAESTRGVRESEKALESQAANSRAVVNSMIAERQEAVRNLSATVAGLKDISEQAEKAFADAFVGRQGQLGGIKGGDDETFMRGDIAALFAARRVQDEIAKLQKQAESHGMSATDLQDRVLVENGATAADLARVKALRDKIAAIDAAKAAEKDALKAAEQAKRESEQAAKAAAAERKRQQDQLIAEGKRVAESVMTDAEKQQAEQARLNDLFRKGAIDAETLQRATAKLHESKNKPEKSPKIAERKMLDALLPGSAEAELAFLNSRLNRAATKAVPAPAAEAVKAHGRIVKHPAAGTLPRFPRASGMRAELQNAIVAAEAAHVPSVGPKPLLPAAPVVAAAAAPPDRQNVNVMTREMLDIARRQIAEQQRTNELLEDAGLVMVPANLM